MLRQKPGLRILLVSLLVALTASLALPLDAGADGGPVAGPGLWEQLKEGQQIALVTLNEDGTANVDLFVSLLDDSGQSHEITYFLPLGYEVNRFGVFEEDSWDFQDAYTRELDERLVKEARLRRETLEALFGGTLLVNGVWLLPVWGPLLLSGCGNATPVATYETDSSTVSIFGLDDDTDLDSLIATTGLDASVRNTLERLRGQRIAVVTLQTQPMGGDTGDSDGGYHRGEPGLHLSWTTAMTNGEEGQSYAYPLGTGESWFHPVEQTRIYVFAPPGMDVSIDYPELGEGQSGFKRNGQPNIIDYYNMPAYAVEDAAGDFGYIWRATYLESNAAEDIVITAKPSGGSNIIGAALHNMDRSLLFLFSFIVALALWMLGWRYLAPRLLGESFQGNPGRLWRFALIFTGFNIILLVPGAFVYLIWTFTGSFFALLILLALFGGVGILVLFAKRVKYLGADTRKAIVAFILVTLASNGAYLLLSLAYLWAAGTI